MRSPTTVTSASAIGEAWAGIPGVEITPTGRLFVVFFSGGPREPDPANTVYLCRSDDGGAHFGAPVRVAEPAGSSRAFDPALWLDPGGRLWLIYNRSNRETGEHGVFARTCEEPDADEPAWSPEYRAGYDVPFCFRLNKPVVLSSDEWIMPVTHAPAVTKDWFAADAQVQGAGISRDDGRTWSLHGAVRAPEWALENMIIERSDGVLVMYIRTGSGLIWRSLSQDRGLSWSPAEPAGIPNPGSRFFVRRLASGDWLLINSPDPKRRTGIVASISSDEGATWSRALVLDPRDQVSYPDAAIDADGYVYVVHDRDRYGAAEILLSRFHLSDVPRQDGAAHP